MPKLELWFPVRPFVLVQPFGGNPDYYARFLDPYGQPEKGHMGVDLLAPHATPLYAPCDGTAFYVTDAHGGDGIYIKTTDGVNLYFVILWHLCSKDDPQYKPLIPTDGRTEVKTGQLIGYTDNTGAPFESSGDHLHFGLAPIDDREQLLYPRNGYGGCIDPTPYFNNYFATDSTKVISILKRMVDLLTNFISSIKT